MEPWHIELVPSLILASCGVIAGIVNTLAGGGSLIVFPLLIFSGLPATVANGTLRLGILIQCATATYRYHQKGVVPWNWVKKLLLPAFIAAGAGAYLATQVAPGRLKFILGIAIFVAGLFVVFSKSGSTAQPNNGSKQLNSSPLLYLALFASAFYGGFLQAGVGYILLATLTTLGGATMVQANIAKMALVMCFTPLTLSVFAYHGQVHWGYACILAIGLATGAIIGVSLNLWNGNKIARPLVGIAVVASTIKLLLW